VRQIESLHDNAERIAFSFSKGVPDHKLGGQCSLLKVVVVVVVAVVVAVTMLMAAILTCQ
jgi:hypothetical protein